MKKIDIINNIQSFNFFKNQLVLKKTDGSLYNNNIKFNFKGKPYAILENGHFCDIQKTEVEIYDIGFNLLTKIEKIGVIAGGRISNTDYFSIRWEDDNENEFLSIYKETEELKIYDYFIGRFLGINYRIVFNDYDATEIKLYHNIIKDKFLWSYTCPEGRKIEGDLYEYEGVLAFSHRDKDFKITAVGLDIETGSQLWEKEGTHTLGAKNEDKVYNFVSSSNDNRDYLQILDIKTGQLEEKTLTTNQKNDYIVWLSTYRNGKIYCSNLAYGCKLGIVDVEKKELIAEYPLNLKEGVQIYAPLVTEDKIYILDSENVLHIYEREDIL